MTNPFSKIAKPEPIESGTKAGGASRERRLIVLVLALMKYDADKPIATESLYSTSNIRATESSCVATTIDVKIMDTIKTIREKKRVWMFITSPVNVPFLMVQDESAVDKNLTHWNTKIRRCTPYSFLRAQKGGT